jgi:hypothetical protein
MDGFTLCYPGLVPEKNLKVQQMDVKGAYLNRKLQETIHMRQSEGCEDSTDRVFQLIKMMYGLKQAGHEWNKLFDEQLRKYGYHQLYTDPSVYIQWDGDDCAFITIWVNNLLLLASSDHMMKHMKHSIQSEWEVTDLGQPNKITGIEITLSAGQVTISQRKYIKSVLEKERMNAKPVGMPLDPNVKLVPNPEDNEPNQSNVYTKLLGALQYIANFT